MKIGTRLLAAFIIVGAITAVIAIPGAASLGKIADLAKASYEQETLALPISSKPISIFSEWIERPSVFCSLAPRKTVTYTRLR